MGAHAVPAAQAVCRVLIPDVDGALVRPLRLLAELLGDLRAWTEAQGQRPGLSLPGAVGDCTTLLSVRRLVYVLEPDAGLLGSGARHLRT